MLCAARILWLPGRLLCIPHSKGVAGLPTVRMRFWIDLSITLPSPSKSGSHLWLETSNSCYIAALYGLAGTMTTSRSLCCSWKVPRLGGCTSGQISAERQQRIGRPSLRAQSSASLSRHSRCMQATYSTCRVESFTRRVPSPFPRRNAPATCAANEECPRASTSLSDDTRHCLHGK